MTFGNEEKEIEPVNSILKAGDAGAEENDGRTKSVSFADGVIGVKDQQNPGVFSRISSLVTGNKAAPKPAGLHFDSCPG